MARCLMVLLLVYGLGSAEAPFISDADWDRGAAVAGTRDGEAPAESSAGAGPVAALLIGLVFLGAIVVGGVVLVRLAARRRHGGAPARHLQMIESLPLGLKRSLHLVRLGDQVLVVGSHEQGLTAVTSLPAAHLPGLLEAEARAEAALAMASGDAATPPPSAGAPFAQAFAHAVQSVLGRERR